MTDAPVSVAFVGAGGMAREHARAFADVPGVTLAGVHSRTRARAEQLAADFGMPVVCDDVAELWSRTRADLVVIAVPELEARRVAEAAFAFPWRVLMEKPAGYDLDDALAIQRAADAAGRQVWVALNRRFHGSTDVLLDDLAARDEPRFIVVHDQEDLEAALAAGQPRTVVENWMYANSIHVIDYFRVLGRGRITAVTPVVPFRPDAPFATVCRIDFESGDVGLYEGLWNAPGPWAVTVTTSRRRWELRPLERAAYQDRGTRTLVPVDSPAWDTAFKPGFRAQAEQVVAGVRGLTTRAVSLADAVETMRLVHAMFEQRRP